jgi:hypothetical protein
LILFINCFTVSVIVTGGKFNTSVVDTDGNLLQVTLTEVANYGDTLTQVANVPPVISVSHGKDVATRCRYQFAAAAIGTSGAP